MLKVTSQLAKIIGEASSTKKNGLVKVWDYIKGHNLQNPMKKTEILPDENLKAVFNNKNVVGFTEIMGLLTPHYEVVPKVAKEKVVKFPKEVVQKVPKEPKAPKEPKTAASKAPKSVPEKPVKEGKTVKTAVAKAAVTAPKTSSAKAAPKKAAADPKKPVKATK